MLTGSPEVGSYPYRLGDKRASQLVTRSSDVVPRSPIEGRFLASFTYILMCLTHAGLNTLHVDLQEAPPPLIQSIDY